ncbi:MAG TPA: SDR family oxidoreductase [Actinocrinis sp.]|jgi:NAD(P)-dependent dehydrogenase (short-subunit alcohol dehydrogenase family)|uniref:SDR family NAD(P)-dependent oxidoreductase n=1 Tax=Actinocrinis sp. TaxID=1920516 RepID=UPI002DDC95C2|nr:SDR family oxidoreductase [Actinocrinis sp.]HEV3172618.1 SDR family oxidoreductase [Actinocrinis sp.]
METQHVDTQPLAGSTAIVTGASRGFGRAICAALAGAGARVIGVARTRTALEQVEENLSQVGASFIPFAADATDPTVAGLLLDEYRPDLIVLDAGASPLARPVQHHTWETFSAAWEMDVRQAFHWTREALLTPLRPGSQVIAFSSGAAVAGSPMSGGYSGAKAMIRFLMSYAADESDRAGLGIRFTAVLPALTPETQLGARAVAAYANRAGVDVETFLKERGPILTPKHVGEAVLGLATGAEPYHPASMLTASGLTPLK